MVINLKRTGDFFCKDTLFFEVGGRRAEVGGQMLEVKCRKSESLGFPILVQFEKFRSNYFCFLHEF